MDDDDAENQVEEGTNNWNASPLAPSKRVFVDPPLAFEVDLPLDAAGKARYYAKRVVRCSCISLSPCQCAWLLVFLFVVYIVLYSAIFPLGSSQASATCDERASRPGSKERNVSTTFCVTHYQVEDWFNPGVETFFAGTSNETITRFLVLGDWGRDGFCCQRDVALEMERIARKMSIAFVINTGDSFYDEGLQSVDDVQLNTSFRDVYQVHEALSQLKFFGVLGNHEYRGNVSAVLDLHDPAFIMPKSHWYTMVHNQIQFLFLDTTPLIPSYASSSHKKHPQLAKERARSQEQLAWLEKELQSKQDEYKARFVIGHHPIQNESDRYDEDRTLLQRRVAPLLEKYKVTAYLAGHDHNLHYTKPASTHVGYFVSGAGSKLHTQALLSTLKDVFLKSVQFHYIRNGFLACEVNLETSQFRVLAIDMNGLILNSAVLELR